VHCSHHKAGTNWLRNVLIEVARAYGLRYREVTTEPVPTTAELMFYRQAHRFSREALAGRPFRGSHMIRDPRDLAVSGYHYHLWTDEEWCVTPRPAFGGKSYQERLRSLSFEDGLFFEIRRAAGGDIAKMAAWDYRQPEFCELRYEDLIADEEGTFAELFESYGFTRSAIERGVAIARANGFEATKKKEHAPEGRSHLRSGRPGEWRDVFTEAHKRFFKSVAGDALIALGYEKDDRW